VASVRTMRAVAPGEVPVDGGTAVQDHVRIRCGRCATVNIAAEVAFEPARRPGRTQ
jgi:phage FluMu protein Com